MDVKIKLGLQLSQSREASQRSRISRRVEQAEFPLVPESRGFFQYAKHRRNPHAARNHDYRAAPLGKKEAAVRSIDSNPPARLNVTELIGAISRLADHETKPRQISGGGGNGEGMIVEWRSVRCKRHPDELPCSET
jgi:hypothetical protein